MVWKQDDFPVQLSDSFRFQPFIFLGLGFDLKLRGDE